VGRSFALSWVAVAMARAGRQEEAVPIFQEALRVARGIEDEGDRSFALSWVAVAMAEAGQWEEALPVAQGIKDEEALALRAVAVAMARAGRWEEALPVAQGIKDEEALALREVAEAMARAGRVEEALQVARGIEKVHRRAGALAKLAEVVLGVQEEQEDIASEILEMLEQLTTEIVEVEGMLPPCFRSVRRGAIIKMPCQD